MNADANDDGPAVALGRWRRRLIIGAMVLSAGALVIGCVAQPLFGFQTVRSSAAPLRLSEGNVGYETFDRVLAQHVREGRVRYADLARSPEPLARFVRTLATVGPTQTPARFPNRGHRLAYYLNAYNALVLYAVVRHWPIRSVHDVHGAVEPEAGFGFFYAQRFVLDGHTTNLYDLEHDVIRGFGDARIHAAINCASASCPSLRGRTFRAEGLSDQLDEVMRDFCSSAPHVRVNAAERTVELSSIFEWFREDFVRDAARLGERPTLLDYVYHYARPEMREAIATARREGYRVRHVPYDWSLNGR